MDDNVRDSRGLPVIGVKKPINVEVLSDGVPEHTVVRDAATGRRIDGITRMEWVVTPNGSELRLVLGPGCYKLTMSNNPAQVKAAPFFRIVDIETEEPLVLQDGSVLIGELSETQRVILTAKVLEVPPDVPTVPARSESIGKQVEGTGTGPETPDTGPGTEGIEGGDPDSSRRLHLRPRIGRRMT